MKEDIYMNASIIDFGNGNIRCSFDQSIGDGELESRELTKDEALRLIWELVLAGGKREVRVNRYDRDIVTVSAAVILEH